MIPHALRRHPCPKQGISVNTSQVHPITPNCSTLIGSLGEPLYSPWVVSRVAFAGGLRWAESRRIRWTVEMLSLLRQDEMWCQPEQCQIKLLLDRLRALRGLRLTKTGGTPTCCNLLHVLAAAQSSCIHLCAILYRRGIGGPGRDRSCELLDGTLSAGST